MEQRQEAASPGKGEAFKGCGGGTALKDTASDSLEKGTDPRTGSEAFLPAGRGGRICLSARKKGQGLSFVLEQGQRIALTGGNGSGKSSVIREILKTAAQETQEAFKEAQADGPERGACGLIRLSGELSLPSDLKISYVPRTLPF